MTKQKIVAEMRKIFGQQRGVINVNEFSSYMGIDRSTARREWLQGLEYYSSGRTKWYDMRDVAERLLERRTI